MANKFKIGKYRRLRRYNQIINVLVRNGFGYLVQKSGVLGVVNRGRNFFDKSFEENPKLTEPERFRKVVEELGPTFIKLGQVLSTRADLLPSEYIEELSKLQDNASVIEFDKIKRVIENELGADISELFKSIDPVPLASASIAQVHNAVLKNGDRVVVKVMKTGVAEIIENDLIILFDIARLVEDKFDKSYIYQPTNIVEELSESIRKELDFTREGRNTDKFLKHFKGSKDIYAAKIYWELTNKKVIVMEFIDGIKINDIKGLKSRNINSSQIADKLAHCYLDQIFKAGFFHADPHPGNILVKKDGKIAFLDFGLTGTIEKTMMDDLLNLMASVAGKNVKKATSMLMKIGVINGEIDEISLRKDIGELIDDYYDRPLQDIELSEAMNQIFSIALKHGIAIPPQLTLLVKTIVTIEGVVSELDPGLKIIELFKEYSKDAIKDRYRPTNLVKDIFSYAQDVAEDFYEFPSQISKLLSKLNSDKVKVDIVHSGFDSLINNMNRMVNRIVLSIIVAALIVGSALLAQVKSNQRVFGIPVIGFAGFIFGGIIGIWIVISILKSGKA